MSCGTIALPTTIGTKTNQLWSFMTTTITVCIGSLRRQATTQTVPMKRSMQKRLGLWPATSSTNICTCTIYCMTCQSCKDACMILAYNTSSLFNDDLHRMAPLQQTSTCHVATTYHPFIHAFFLMRSWYRPLWGPSWLSQHHWERRLPPDAQLGPEVKHTSKLLLATTVKTCTTTGTCLAVALASIWQSTTPMSMHNTGNNNPDVCRATWQKRTGGGGGLATSSVTNFSSTSSFCKAVTVGSAYNLEWPVGSVRHARHETCRHKQ